jgi:hypothetical protein
MKRFIEFLERNNAWENFERAFKDQERDVEEYKKECKVWKNLELTRAFTWDYTKEGYKYWSNLNDLWRGENETLKEQLLSGD